MDTGIVYSEFIYSMAEQSGLEKIKNALLQKSSSYLLSGLDAARLLVNFELFANGTPEDLHLAIMQRAEHDGGVRRYLNFLSSTLADYLPCRAALCNALENYKNQSSVSLYQAYCAWKGLFNKLQQAQLTCQDLPAMQMALELCEEYPGYEQLTTLLKAFDRHHEACRAIDIFLDKPLTKSAQQKAKALTAEFLGSLNELKVLNYPLYYESLAQFVTTTHGQASRALSLLLSAERLYRLEANGAPQLSITIPEAQGAAQAAPATRRNNGKLIAGGGVIVFLLLCGGFVALKGGNKPAAPAVRAPITTAEKAAVPVAQAVVPPVAPAPAEEKPAVIEKTDNGPKIATIFTTSSAGVKACASGALTSADCPEKDRGFLGKGAHVTILEENNDGWSRIEAADGKNWWVFSGFLKGEEQQRDCRPVTTSKNLTVFADQELKKTGNQVLKPDTSACGRAVNEKIFQLLSPTGKIGYISRDKVTLP